MELENQKVNRFVIYIRRFISFMVFALFVYIFFNIAYEKHIKKIAINDYESKAKEITYVEQTTEEQNFEILNDSVSPSDTEELIELRNKYNEFITEIDTNKNGDKFYNKNLEYITNLYKGVKFLGDSNVAYFSTYSLLDPKNLGIMKGKSITEQIPLVSEHLNTDINTYVLWNGYNIKYFADAKEFVNSYKELIEKIRSVCPNADVYVCSLLPATDEKVREDMESDFCHNIYLGPEYDAALYTEFGDHYIDTKRLMVKELHIEGDGVHFQDTFYRMLIPYVILNISIQKEKNKDKVVPLKKTYISANHKFNEVFDVFKLNDMPYTKKYYYDNLESYYQAEKFTECFSRYDFGKYYSDNKESLVELAKNIAFMGDSNTDFIKVHCEELENQVFSMKGKSIIEQYNLVDEFDLSKFDTLIMWNGYVIKEFNSSKEYVIALNRLIEKIQKKYPKLKIYVNSIEPCSVDKLLEDLSTGSPHNMHLGLEYDKAISDIFPDKYIDSKFLVTDTMIAKDGYHYKNAFYERLIPFLILYVNMERVRNTEIASKSEIEKLSYVSKTKELYMTFDDGPSEYTYDVLKILEKYDAKATFFVTGINKNYTNRIINIYNAGHAIGAHTYKHDYSIYESEEKYFDDLYNILKIIREITGKWTNIIRFPGGSGNTSSKKYSNGIMTSLTKRVVELGYKYYDWNVSSGDGSGATTSEQILMNAKNGIDSISKAIILFHETRDTTVSILDEFVNYAKNKGFSMKSITGDSDVMWHQKVLN